MIAPSTAFEAAIVAIDAGLRAALFRQTRATTRLSTTFTGTASAIALKAA